MKIQIRAKSIRKEVKHIVLSLLSAHTAALPAVTTAVPVDPVNPFFLILQKNFYIEIITLANVVHCFF